MNLIVRIIMLKSHNIPEIFVQQKGYFYLHQGGIFLQVDSMLSLYL